MLNHSKVSLCSVTVQLNSQNLLNMTWQTTVVILPDYCSCYKKVSRGRLHIGICRKNVWPGQGHGRPCKHFLPI